MCPRWKKLLEWNQALGTKVVVSSLSISGIGELARMAVMASKSRKGKSARMHKIEMVGLQVWKR